MKQLDRIEWKLDQILVKLNEKPVASSQVPEITSKRPEVELHNFTRRQHAVLQMVCRGASNAQIGERLGVTENTAKVHVRTIAKKLKVNTRPQIILCVIDAMKDIAEDSYQVMSGGLPKDWDKNYKPDGDPFDHLLRDEGEKDGT